MISRGPFCALAYSFLCFGTQRTKAHLFCEARLLSFRELTMLRSFLIFQQGLMSHRNPRQRQGKPHEFIVESWKGVWKVLGWVEQGCDGGSSVCGLTGDSARLPAATWSHQHQPDAYWTVPLWPPHFTICSSPVITGFLYAKYGFFQSRQNLFYFF